MHRFATGAMSLGSISHESHSALAIAISYTNNHSVLWAIINGFFSWLYVIYYVLFG